MKNAKLFIGLCLAFLCTTMPVSCDKIGENQEEEIDKEVENNEERQGLEAYFFPSVVNVDTTMVVVNKCDTTRGVYQLGYKGAAPDIKKGSVVVIDGNVVLVTDAVTSKSVVDIKGRLGDLSYVFHNATLNLCSQEDAVKSPLTGPVFYPQTIICGADTVTDQPTKGNTYFGDTFEIWRETYTRKATIYNSEDASIVATPTMSASLNAAFVLEFLDETTCLIDDIEFLKAKQFNFTGRVFGDLSAALNVTADIKKNGSYRGNPSVLVSNILPQLKMRFQIGVLPFWIVMGCDIMSKVDMDYSGQLHYVQDMSCKLSFEEGLKYKPYSAYQVVDKWKNIEVTSDLPSPQVSGRASWTGKLWVYPRFYADVDWILGPSFEIKPYFKANIDAAFSEGNADKSKNYLANTAKAWMGVDAALGVSSFLENAGVSPDSGMYDFGSIAEWQVVDSPSSLCLISSSADRVAKGQTLTLKYQVMQNSSGKETASPFYPIVKIEIPKTGEYYYCFAGINGQAEYTRVPKSSDEIINAMVYDASGNIVGKVSFGDGKASDEEEVKPDTKFNSFDITRITGNSAEFYASYQSNETIFSSGFLISSTVSELYINNSTDIRCQAADGQMKASISDLAPATRYYARPYLVTSGSNGSTVRYGTVKSFSTDGGGNDDEDDNPGGDAGGDTGGEDEGEDAGEDNSDPEVPDIEVSYGSISFGEVEVGDTDSKVFTIKNIGTGQLTGTLEAPEGFKLSSSSFSLASGATKDFRLTFKPQEDKYYQGKVTITSNARSGLNNIVVYGTGVVKSEAKISVDPAELDMGDVIIGNSKTATFRICNKGTGPLKISSVSTKLAYCTSVNWTSGTISAGSSKKVMESLAALEHHRRIVRVVGTVGEVLALEGDRAVIMVDAPLLAHGAALKPVARIDLDPGLCGSHGKDSPTSLGPQLDRFLELPRSMSVNNPAGIIALAVVPSLCCGGSRLRCHASAPFPSPPRSGDTAGGDP